MRPVIELVGRAIEALAVAIIVIAIVHGTVRYLFHLNPNLLIRGPVNRVAQGIIHDKNS